MRIACVLPVLAIGALGQAPQAQILDEFRKTKPEVSEIDVIAEQPLIVAVTGKQGTRRLPAEWAKGELLGVFARRGDGVVSISILPNDEFESNVWVDRQDADSVTLARSDTGYGGRFENIKVFFDPKSYFPKRIVKFPPVRVSRIGYVGRVFTITGSDETHDFIAREQRDGKFVVTPAKASGMAVASESKLEVAQMPTSTIAEVEAARPGEKAVEIGEKVGPYQREGTKIWVGKTFYDGEGSSGIGDIGYFDTAAQTWIFLKLAEMVNWSASALLVEPDYVWVGLVSHGEGSGDSGGLLRYDRRTHAVKKFALPDAVLKIVRVGRAVYCGTSGGFAVVGGDGVKRFEFVPQLDDSYVVVAAGNA